MATEIASSVIAVIRRILQEESIDCPAELGMNARLSDELGLSSMSLAEIVSELEDLSGFDPFSSEVSITDVVTVGDLIAAYSRK